MQINTSNDELYENEHSENIFLDTLISKDKIIEIFLIGGVKLRGTLKGYDEFSILINGEKTKQLIYKHSITTIQCSETNEENWNRNYKVNRFYQQ